ncbi:7-deoxyloganetin glucosyltransferase [Amborella trichopoda]|uniref:7-deoxyloganetin glucosyltransferase n=1 Tax=Amborella trichopoda TaxID=13333 RepID=UPI0005D3203A|nr:7-deoxyloganetin glucosyltransferase [Amborella trichopoda]|eukprot:XP_011626569.1 7-deoxyloganetin glucosyltransferase [Amborella trichopoda]
MELKHLEDFKLESIPDGLPLEHGRDVPSRSDATGKYFLSPFRDLVSKLNGYIQVPRLTCIISDRSFAHVVAKELGILTNENFMTNGELEAVVDWIPGMPNIRLRDSPSFIRTTNLNDPMLQNCTVGCPEALKSSALIINTFEELEKSVLDAIRERTHCPIYTIGPIASFSQFESKDCLKSVSMSLGKEEDACVEWLNNKETSQRPFIWDIRKDLVVGESAMLEKEFVEATKECGLILSWCNQMKVLPHHAIGGFLTHNGWKSTLDSILNGVPMICWPFFADPQTNCWYVCKELGIGMEINNDVKREDVEELVRKLMGGEKGKELQLKAKKSKVSSKIVVQFGGSSHNNFERLIKEVLLKKH